ncbi:hypothetical protein Pan216_11780 [Planctomycetes bacterium Pan216]|uniref:Uncharacterized protein n=1 Tax=Kolteria novifilia TaxID=2527975 RepID=A0A518B030_9BACT|nr:hypothetical protein Pan216_11780 [Planctomycetes bacterium Pan216]
MLRTPRLASNLGYPWNGAWNARGGTDGLAGWPRLLVNLGGVATRVPGDEVVLSNDSVALGLLRASHAQVGKQPGLPMEWSVERAGWHRLLGGVAQIARQSGWRRHKSPW